MGSFTRMSPHSDLPTSLPSDRICLQWQYLRFLNLRRKNFRVKLLFQEHDKSLFHFSQNWRIMDLYQFQLSYKNMEKGKLSTIDATEKCN